MRAGAVLYVENLERVRAFYEGCFGLTVADRAEGYCGLESEAWLLTLVRSAEARPATTPLVRRANTPIKLAFEVTDITTLRPTVADLGGLVDPADTEWIFRNATHCDCVDPEGNVVQLIQPQDG